MATYTIEVLDSRGEWFPLADWQAWWQAMRPTWSPVTPPEQVTVRVTRPDGTVHSETVHELRG